MAWSWKHHLIISGCHLLPLLSQLITFSCSWIKRVLKSSGSWDLWSDFKLLNNCSNTMLSSCCKAIDSYSKIQKRPSEHIKRINTAVNVDIDVSDCLLHETYKNWYSNYFRNKLTILNFFSRRVIFLLLFCRFTVQFLTRSFFSGSFKFFQGQWLHTLVLSADVFERRRSFESIARREWP